MPDCQMCWNDWPSLTGTPFSAIADQVQVCRNCARSMKQVIAFTRHHGLDLVTGEIRSGPQAGPETPGIPTAQDWAEAKRKEEPPSPPAKQARTKH